MTTTQNIVIETETVRMFEGPRGTRGIYAVIRVNDAQVAFFTCNVRDPHGPDMHFCGGRSLTREEFDAVFDCYDGWAR